MFRWVSQKINEDWKDADQQTQNLLMEDFLLHARILRDFFVKPPIRDDVSAQHYFDDPALWETTANTLCRPYLKANKDRLDKKLAHLTYARLTLDEKWDHDAIDREINEAWRQFHSALPPERQSWFKTNV